MPLGIGGLTGLQTLSKVIIGGFDEFKISDLKGLLHLQGQLSIKGLHKVINVVQAKDANLQQKKGLLDLEMEWSDVFNNSRNKILEFEVLEGLRPYDKLRSLKILHYMGTKFLTWVGDASFVCLTQLTLRGCRSCICLPALGHLPSLQMLFIESMDSLERLGSELLGPPNSCHHTTFPSLEVLEFKDMQGWVEWSIGGAFPCLNKMSMINCPKLDVVGVDLIPSLQVLHVEGCSVAVLKSMVSGPSSIISLTLREIKGLTQLHGEVLEHLQALEYLCVSYCEELTYLWESEVDACEILASLQKLEVRECVNLVSLGEKKLNTVINMESLREVNIQSCPRLKSYNCANHVEKLRISSCGSIASLAFPVLHDDLPSTLKIIDIRNCNNIKVSWLLNKKLSSLESLHIERMLSLRLFPDICFVHLTVLKIWGCHNIESIPDNGILCLRRLWIYDCKNLKSFPYERLQSLTSLEEMVISNCPSMDDSFPCGKWPPNLNGLGIGGLKKPISEWGMQNFPTSLVILSLNGENSGMVSFAKAEDDMRNTSTITCSSSFLLPSSLTALTIFEFKELELVSKGMQHLTRLEHLVITRCLKLRDLPETLLPQLSSLVVFSPSPQVRKKCERGKGKYWPFVSQIPHLLIQD